MSLIERFHCTCDVVFVKDTTTGYWLARHTVEELSEAVRTHGTEG